MRHAAWSVFSRLKGAGVDVRDAVTLLGVLALVVGLALIHIAAAFVIPGALVLALGYRRGWY
jgi:hypothetical protein